MSRYKRPCISQTGNSLWPGSAGVLKYFIHDRGIALTRLSIKGSADQKPLANNVTAENRARNRRVEIRRKARDI